MNCTKLQAKYCLPKANASKFKELRLTPGANPGQTTARS